ncbi:MAG TPA: DUF1206 domain-containing protein [Chloroflexia bacterium]|nr:DUF1206 domain-containing protein [Chloroflexia bacterium]
MANTTSSVKGAARDAKQKAEDSSRGGWIEWLSRFGYAVRGVLYIVIGILAVQVALGQGGDMADKDGAIAAIGNQTFGELLLVLVIIGLAGYSLWGFVRAFLDPFDRGNGPKGLLQRAGYIVSAVVYGALIFPTVRFLLHAGDEQAPGGNATADFSAWLMSHQPLGQWLLIIIGVVAFIGGLGQAWLAFSGDFQKDLKFREMSEDSRALARRVGRAGHAARGVVFAMIGFFIAKAAWDADPGQARGLDGTLLLLAQQPYGPLLLGAVALGLIAFGVYSILCARWIKTSDK